NSSAWDLEQLYKDLFLNYSTTSRDAVIQRFREGGEAMWAAFRRNLTAHTTDGMRLRTVLGVAGAGLMLALIALARRQRTSRRRKIDRSDTQTGRRVSCSPFPVARSVSAPPTRPFWSLMCRKSCAPRSLAPTRWCAISLS